MVWFRHSFHKFLVGNIPHIVGAGRGVDGFFADAPVRAANADVFIAAAETAFNMPFKMRQHKQRIVVQQIFAHVHFGKPFGVFYRQGNRTVFVHNVNGAKVPAVYFQRFAVLLGGVAPAFVVGICFNNRSAGQRFFN